VERGEVIGCDDELTAVIKRGYRDGTIDTHLLPGWVQRGSWAAIARSTRLPQPSCVTGCWCCARSCADIGGRLRARRQGVRYPHQSWFRQWSAADEEAVERSLRLTSTDPLRDRPVDELSRGQRQRAWIGASIPNRSHGELLASTAPSARMPARCDAMRLAYTPSRPTSSWCVPTSATWP